MIGSMFGRRDATLRRRQSRKRAIRSGSDIAEVQVSAGYHLLFLVKGGTRDRNGRYPLDEAILLVIDEEEGLVLAVIQFRNPDRAARLPP